MSVTASAATASRRFRLARCVGGLFVCPTSPTASDGTIALDRLDFRADEIGLAR